jgi:hypothetical protein
MSGNTLAIPEDAEGAEEGADEPDEDEVGVADGPCCALLDMTYLYLRIRVGGGLSVLQGRELVVCARRCLCRLFE